ncbi:single-stranded DNA-binding protein [Brumimicrobium salinarum]|uniref:Single-stranded DNA-binding protein n=1 Tax=Brumimicrobium salinarum TaxID=2058658 RepID=A0A2I0R6C8_9FLAO|nr:single-stranded DNA-binding protein [Brumimicrobium salinarum]PKR82134.1 single-stranded DNA-binding protein [Brumimicrobium salinarum]
MRVQQMNHVNLIGQMTSDPTFVEMEGGKKIARFSLSTKETYLDAEGNTKNLKNWHRVTAWGKWVPVLEQLGSKGQALAIEGRLRSRFYNNNGQRKSFTEIEINDMVIL